MSVYIKQNGAVKRFDSGDSWTILSPIEENIKKKIEAMGKPLKDWDIQINYGIKTGFNEAFIINHAKRDELIAADPKSAEIIRPILRGRDIKRYGYTFADLWVILAKFGSHEYLENKYPAIFKHLKKYENELKQRGQCQYTSSRRVNTGKSYPGQHHWLELDNNPSDKYLDDFSKQKIMWAETMRIHKSNITDFPRFSYTDEPFFTDKTCFIATGNYLLFILAFLNSSVGRFLFKRHVSILDNGGYLMQKIYLEHISLPQTTTKQMNFIGNMALSNIIEKSDSKSPEIDQAFYTLLDIKPIESKFIECDNKEPLSR